MLLLRNSYLQFHNKCKRHFFFFFCTTHLALDANEKKKKIKQKKHLTLSFNIQRTYVFSAERNASVPNMTKAREYVDGRQ